MGIFSTVGMSVSELRNTDTGLSVFRKRPRIISDLVEIFIRDEPGVQECLMKILERSSKDHCEQAMIYSNLETFFIET